ncbi:hypothetical protein [Thiohalocapsa sp. ML1]|uniref:hypothetical protein n=1 Tax=Thiohalocapsa sp. ML1 TaxID=1431688 RepID=UPI00073232B1|nr:hypothetical protein [Thiohalocapsa sp. ML1]
MAAAYALGVADLLAEGTGLRLECTVQLRDERLASDAFCSVGARMFDGVWCVKPLLAHACAGAILKPEGYALTRMLLKHKLAAR